MDKIGREIGSDAYEYAHKVPIPELEDRELAYITDLTENIVEVIVRDVIWNVTKHGYLKPTVIFKPVELLKTTVQKVTAFNGKYVVDNVIGPGAIIKVVKSGDVIPQIFEVVKPAPGGEPKMPDYPYKWTKTKVDLIVKD